MLVGLLLLLYLDDIAARAGAAAEYPGQTNLVIDLLHALEVGRGGALGTENDVLQGAISFLFLPLLHSMGLGDM